MHPINSLLPPVELAELEINDEENWQDITKAFAAVNDQDDVRRINIVA
jgi:hypothetical protein